MIPDWPETFQLSEETHTYITVYIALSFIWAASAIILLVSGACTIRKYFMFVPWGLASLAIIMFDVYVAATYAIQASEAKTATELLKLIGVNTDLLNFDNFKPEVIFSGMEYVTSIPAFIMALVAARGVVIWLKNLIMIIAIFFAARNFVRKKHSELPRYPHNRNADAPNWNGNKALHEENGHVQRESHLVQQPTVHQPTLSANQYEQILPHPIYDAEGYIRPRKPYLLEGDINSRPFSYTQGNPILPKRNSQLSEAEPEYVEPDDQPPRFLDRPQIRRKDTPMSPQIPWRQQVERSNFQQAERNNSQQVERNNSQQVERNNSQQVERNDSHRSNASAQLSDELRSQLPWSYYHPRDVQSKPQLKRTQETVMEEMPPVPVPDYTLHFGKNSRPSTNWTGSSSTQNHDKPTSKFPG